MFVLSLQPFYINMKMLALKNLAFFTNGDISRLQGYSKVIFMKKSKGLLGYLSLLVT
jgi:hypothetical protein